MKAIELMQKIGELVVAHGDIEVVNMQDDIKFSFIHRVRHNVIELSGYQDFNVIEISSEVVPQLIRRDDDMPDPNELADEESRRFWSGSDD